MRALLHVDMSGFNESSGVNISSRTMRLLAVSRDHPEVCEFSVLVVYVAIIRCHEEGQTEYFSLMDG